ncbi:MAG TPA: cellulase family glycosylhydrolase [Polyangia bacterium]|nr:cellulase family glycosylhydrolase [Polyangia bacterium]
MITALNSQATGRTLLPDDPRMKGVNTHVVYYGQDVQAPAVATMAAAGVRTVRIDVNWGGHEPVTKGSYDAGRVANLDAFMLACAAADIDVLVVVTGCPPWANGNQAINVPPTNSVDFADFCVYLVGRYPTMRALEVWNEPDLDYAWAVATGTIAQRTTKYVSILAAAYPAIKAAAPKVKVLAPSLSGTGSASWLGGFFDAGGKGKYDALSVHMYGDPPDHGDLTPGQLLRTWVSQIGVTLATYGEGQREVWITEFGWNTAPAGVSEAVQAAYLTEFFSSARSYIPNCSLIFWYQLFNQLEGSGVGNDNLGLTHQDFTPKLALAAFTNL